VLVDATIVRMILVPATMELLGDANWWTPGWLNKILPNVHIEGVPPCRPRSPPSWPAKKLHLRWVVRARVRACDTRTISPVR